ncbi:MAG TPA: trypsin-like peptidase domain-containing protein [Acidimicrobiia bacterium]
MTDQQSSNEPALPIEGLPSSATPPPTAAPSPAATPPKKSRRGWHLLWIIPVLFALGLGAGWLWFGDGLDQIDGGAVTTTTAAAVSTTPTIATDVDEPVAAVAQALLPSMVQIETEGGLGSGVIYDSSGLILTAAHVVEGSDQVTVRLNDGDRVQGQVVGGSQTADVAVVKVDRTDLQAAALALDTEPEVGQMAIAIGSPWGLEQTVTAGVVSAVDRSVDGPNGPRSFLQTDASINPGNSGGALADRHGRVIGINTEIFTSSGGSQGVGFAVPIQRAYEVAGKLVAGQPIETAFLGVSIEDSQQGTAGAVVTEIEPGTPAALAGLQTGDLVVSIDGEPVQSSLDLAAAVRSADPGDQVTLEVLREGQTVSVTVELGTR